MGVGSPSSFAAAAVAPEELGNGPVSLEIFAMPGLNSRMHEVHFDQGITHAYFLDIFLLACNWRFYYFLTIFD